METALEQSPYGQAVSYSKQKLHISPDTFRDLFKSTTEALIKHLERMFRDDKLSDLENLIMVGGFSECELIQHRMKEKFGKHKKIIIPEEAGLAVLKGAVLYGHQPKAISARVLRRTYGIQSWRSGILRCIQNQRRSIWVVLIGARMYSLNMSRPNPRYVTDPSCQRLGNLIIPLPEIRAGQTLEIEETMVFGDTELLVRARDLHTGRVVETQFDLL
ncbi:unnamed protein product [Mytilus edulis]|uniref:Hsp70 family protein n=1 Tax=Mytilus edulis TaxID=6550 RepID=A0A8S3PTS1_MYTED|nr:unnamed protein product [Mytilus edulis]